MNQHMQPISIIVPTLNEADNILLLFQRINATLTSSNIPYEIIVIDDHSTDRTVQIAQFAGSEYNARVIMKRGEPGKAASLLEGFEAAEHEIVCMIDGDLQYPPEAIKLMYHKMQFCEADIVLTERVNNQTSKLRRLMSGTFNLLFTRLLFGITYDTQSGLKLFRKSILKNITLNPSPWTFDLEFIVRALEKNYVIVSQQINFSERYAGVPKIHILAATKEIAIGSLKLRRSSSSKRVKTSYQKSQLLQSTVNWIVAIVAVSLVAVAVPTQKADALSTPTTYSAADQSLTRGLLDTIMNIFDGGSNDNNQPVAQQPSVKPDTASPVMSMPAVAAATTPVTTVAAQSVPANTQSTATQSSIAVNSSSPMNTTTNPQGSAEASPTATTTAAKPDETKYYPQTKLSDNRTSQLQSLALLIVIVGGSLIGFGLIIAAIKYTTARIRHRIYT